jgi:hypothetical protein
VEERAGERRFVYPQSFQPVAPGCGKPLSPTLSPSAGERELSSGGTFKMHTVALPISASGDLHRKQAYEKEILTGTAAEAGQRCPPT